MIVYCFFFKKHFEIMDFILVTFGYFGTTEIIVIVILSLLLFGKENSITNERIRSRN